MARMQPKMKSSGTKALLLVGGLGTRLRGMIPLVPKPLAPVGERPFLDLLIRQLVGQGIKHLIMCTGYLAEQIECEFGDGRDVGASIEYSKEPQPLGTAGAIKFAQTLLQGVPEFLVMNGDSFLELDFHQFVQFHRAHGGIATMAVVPVDNAGRYGTVHADSNSRVTSFLEKTGNSSPGLINAGIYIFKRSILEHIPGGTVSLEKEVFPRILDHGVYVSRQRGQFIDIGTPTDYIDAQNLFKNLCRKTKESHTALASSGRDAGNHYGDLGK